MQQQCPSFMQQAIAQVSPGPTASATGDESQAKASISAAHKARALASHLCSGAFIGRHPTSIPVQLKAKMSSICYSNHRAR
jgi:hypothetical protein